MQKRPVIKGLYAISPDLRDTSALLHKTGLAIRGGACVIQYRHKSADARLRFDQANALHGLCNSLGASLIINDDVTLAAQIDADGVHLGKEDGDIALARSVLGPAKIIGVSCYNQPELASLAAQQGADYIAFGAFFPSATKPNAKSASPALLHWAKRHLTLPVVAIGGITLENAPSLIDAGADAVAVISALFDSEDVSLTATQFSTLFAQGSV